jgi:hypothetical protein
MEIRTRRTFLSSLCVLGAAGYAAANSPTVAHAAPQGFLIFDGLLYSPMPDLRELGMPKLLGAGTTWGANVAHDEVDPVGIKAAVEYLRRLTRNYYFDLEEWTVSGAPREVIDANIRKLVRTAEIARQSAPDMKFGFYDMAPRSTYWAVVLNKSDALAQWWSINRRSAVIAAKVDYLFPSLYTFYDDPSGWELAALATLKEARQYGKPVYPFLWPEFHDSNVKLAGTQVPRDFWRRQLEVCRQHADGLVLWGGFKRLWDEEAPWWVETKSFVKSLGAAAGSAA